MQGEFPRLRDVFVQVVSVGCDVVVIDIQLGEAQMSLVGILAVNAIEGAQSAVGSQIDGALTADDGRVPVELRIGQSVVFGIVVEHTCLGIELRKTVPCRNPEDAALVFHDSLHSIVGQSVLYVEVLVSGVSVLVLYAPVEPVFVAAYPQTAVAGFIETAHLLDNP